jgi:3',5'-cyclic AMP phosphodiesterase CpdA
VSSSILHVSDLHFGARNGLDDPTLEQALGELVQRVDPELVVASGDLSHHGYETEHAAAARYLRELGKPLLVVPGNHDIPTLPPARLTHPWREFKRQWQTTAAVYSSPQLQVVGLNSVRPWMYQGGGVSTAQLEQAEAGLGQAQPGALGVVALHHQLAGAPWRTHKLPLSRRSAVLSRLASAGAELILSGHVHQATVSERSDFEVVGGVARTCVLATAPGLGRPRPDRPTEARGVLVHVVTEQQITVETYMWRDSSWTPTATRAFPRPT